MVAFIHADKGNTYVFTSESVSEGHPDKLCDQLSDAVLDAYPKGDPESKVACETAYKDDMVTVLGEPLWDRNSGTTPSCVGQ